MYKLLKAEIKKNPPLSTTPKPALKAIKAIKKPAKPLFLPSPSIPEEFTGFQPLVKPAKETELVYEIDWDKVTSLHDVKTILSVIAPVFYADDSALSKIGYLTKLV